MVFKVLSLRTGRNVHRIDGFSPRDPGQKPGQESGPKLAKTRATKKCSFLLYVSTVYSLEAKRESEREGERERERKCEREVEL